MQMHNKNGCFVVIFSECECLMLYDTSTCNQLFMHERLFEEIVTQHFYASHVYPPLQSF